MARPLPDDLRTMVEEATRQAMMAGLARAFNVNPAEVPEMLHQGEQIQAALVSGEFDDSPVGRLYADWLNDEPLREAQRATFVRVAMAIGCSKGQVADRLLSCITAAMASQHPNLGDLLANELDRLGAWSAPTTPDQVAAQRGGIEAFAKLKAWFRRQDVAQEAVKLILSRDFGVEAVDDPAELRKIFIRTLDALSEEDRNAVAGRIGQAAREIALARNISIE